MDPATIGFIFYAVTTLGGLLVLGLLIGGFNERRHLRSLAEREAACRHIRVSNLPTVTNAGHVAEATMVMANVVIATDVLKTFLTSVRGIVGGRMGAAERLFLRARREALLRLIAEAESRGAVELWNVRFDFCNIGYMRSGSGERTRGAMQVEVVAWATAVRR